MSHKVSGKLKALQQRLVRDVREHQNGCRNFIASRLHHILRSFAVISVLTKKIHNPLNKYKV